MNIDLAICSGCGDPVYPGKGCCGNCCGKVTKITEKLIERVKELYWEDNRKPVKIWKMTGIHPDVVKEIVGI